MAAGMQLLLQGPRRYLVLVANNAEMRAGSGMFLSVGVASFADGAFSVGDFRPTPDFNLPAGSVAVPPDLQNLWGFLHPTEEWRNLASTPRFDVSASLAAQMSVSFLGTRRFSGITTSLYARPPTPWSPRTQRQFKRISHLRCLPQTPACC